VPQRDSCPVQIDAGRAKEAAAHLMAVLFLVGRSAGLSTIAVSVVLDSRHARADGL